VSAEQYRRAGSEATGVHDLGGVVAHRGETGIPAGIYHLVATIQLGVAGDATGQHVLLAAIHNGAAGHAGVIHVLEAAHVHGRADGNPTRQDAFALVTIRDVVGYNISLDGNERVGIRKYNAS
jgi:hypothetical protein